MFWDVIRTTIVKGREVFEKEVQTLLFWGEFDLQGQRSLQKSQSLKFITYET